MWDLNLGLPLFRAYDLPHCTGLGEDLKVWVDHWP